ncbi:MAG: HAMP domain-containing histidine kinase [Paraprevotella sp.]|nr:HAMP domain-containing histidine kinase [Paraprevotella sp.]
MKRSTIWIISIIMGASFLGLLYLQMNYLEKMVTMRKEQFDDSVLRSLDQASRDLERNETFRYLEKIANKSGLYPDTLDMGALSVLNAPDFKAKAHFPLSGKRQDAIPSFRLKTLTKHPSQMPKALNLNRKNIISEATISFQEYVKHAYVYQKGVLDEVIYSILYSAGNKPFKDRINFKLLDLNLRSALESNGVNMPFHFVVTTSDGRELYRCADYVKKGDEYSYSQTLFRNDPPDNMGVVRIHFPDMGGYLLGSAKIMLPAIAFTIILFVTFIFTVYIIFRQKKITEMKNDFINNLTHEFKTPISSISLAAQMLADDSIKKSESMYTNLSRVIYDETKRLRFQVEKVLQMSLYDRGNIAFKKKQVHANNLIEGVIKTFSLKVEQNGGEITSYLNADSDLIYVDGMHFTNVIFNLMDNAVKYKRDDVDLHLTVSTWNVGDKLMISVEDNGVGIQKDDLKRVFDKFYRVNTGNKHDVKGFGLGLAYVKKMVELHKGNIKAESEFGNGTRFIITLTTL